MSGPTNAVEALRESCPQPDKHRYLDEATATMQARRLERRRRAYGTLSVYQCRCRLWHLTSRTDA